MLSRFFVRWNVVRSVEQKLARPMITAFSTETDGTKKKEKAEDMDKKYVNKVQLVKMVSTKTGLSKPEVSSVLSSVLDSIIETVEADKEIRLLGFGTFKQKKMSPQNRRNPRTGEIFVSEAKTKLGFKATVKLGSEKSDEKDEK